jgi:hypothetical protein
MVRGIVGVKMRVDGHSLLQTGVQQRMKLDFQGTVYQGRFLKYSTLEATLRLRA